ncbi:MAG: flagellar motor protein MotA [Pseudomonadota bacterium]
MIVFLILTGFIVLILSPQILSAFLANPGLNGLIVGVLLIGIILAFRQVVRLFREIAWVNAFRIADPGVQLDRQPVLLAPMEAMLRDRAGRMALTSQTTRSMLESIGSRLDEARDISRYMISLLVFLGLLGTFWGLLETVGSVAATIQQLDVGGGDIGLVFEDLKSGLEAPLSGMGTAFSSSLFGLAGSLILGFLDLQAGQAQNRFYMDLEDWLSSVTDLSIETTFRTDDSSTTPEHLVRVQAGLERLSRQVGDSGGQNRQTTQAMADLAEGIQGLVQHMRSEQKLLRDWIDSQGEQQRIMNTYLARLSGRSDDFGE